MLGQEGGRVPQLCATLIFKRLAGQPPETPWLWEVEFHQREGRTPPHQGITTDRESAMAAFKRCWESADIPVRKPPRKQW